MEPKSEAALDGAAQKSFKSLQQYPTTELGNALILRATHRGKLRYDPKLNIWLFRSKSGVWREDNTNAQAIQAMRSANEVRRNTAFNIPETNPDPAYLELRKRQLGWAAKSEQFRVAQASVKWAETMPDFVVDPELWDRDHYALGTPSGIFDLRTGKLRPENSESYVSKSTSISPSDSDTLCPLWLDFLHKAMQGDINRITYLQRLAGYALSGSVREQSLTWFVGGGGNGKGTFLDALTAIYGDYAHPMRTEPLLATRYESHPTEICDLRGRRLVIASETQEDRTWNEALLKKLTGGDPITARRMRQDSVTFLPTHTLIVSCNNQPTLSSVGEAERRRFQILEWGVSFKYADDPTFRPGDVIRDETFNRRLEEEYPAILRWAMAGTLEWLKHGLKPPDSVLLSSQDYIVSQDMLGQWISDCLVLSQDSWTPSIDLWASWAEWTSLRGVLPGRGIQGFIPKLTKREGLKACKDSDGNRRGIQGARLKNEAEMSEKSEIVKVN